MVNNYTNGRGGAFGNIIKKIQNFINPPKSNSTPINIPKYSQISQVVGKTGSVNAPGASSTYKPPTTPTLSTTKPNTAFTSRMPNQQISIPGPNVSREASAPNFNGSFTPPTNTGFNDFLKRISAPLPKVTSAISKFNPAIATAIGTTGGVLGGAKAISQNSTPRQALSYFFDRAGTYAGLPEFRISELVGSAYADGGTPTSGTPSGKYKGTNINTSNVNQSKANKSSKATNDALAKQAQKDAQLAAETSKYNDDITNYNSSQAADTGSLYGENDIYGWESDYNNFLNQDFQDQADYENKYAEFLRQQQEDQFNFLKSTYESQIPGLETQVNQQVADQQANLERLGRDTAARKIEEENTYGDMIKRLVKNTNAQQVQAGNVFSGLGTADSSAFQNVLGNIKSTGLEGITNYERDLGKNVSSINSAFENSKRETESLIAQIKNEGAIKKQAIMNQINASAEEKAQKIGEINMQLEQAIMDAKSFLSQKKAELLAQKGTFYQNEYALNNQYNRDLGLQNNEYQLMAKLQNTLTPSLDPTAQTAIQAFAKKRITPTPNNPEVLQLQQLTGLSYQEIVNLINQYS